MAGDIFGGLLKGLSGFMPQDDPDVKLMTAQSELSDLRNQETELYAQLGRRTLAEHPGQYPELESRLKLIGMNIGENQAKLDKAQEEKKQKENRQKQEDESRTCPDCGNLNPEGVKFCQECGAKLGTKKVCPSCGASVTPGVRFCGECGANLGG